MAATMLAGHPQALTSPTGSWEQEQHLMAHLSPNSRYEHSSTDDLVEIINGSPTQLSPQPYGDREGCNDWVMMGLTADYSGYANGSHYLSTGGQSPDSGIYSPDGSPHSIDLSSVTDTRIQPSCPLPPLSTTGDIQQQQSCIQDYTSITTSAPLHQPPQLFTPASYAQTTLPYDGMLYQSESATIGYHNFPEVPEAGTLDPIPIISCDQVTGNPIRFYSDCNKTDLSPRPSFIDSMTPSVPNCYPSGAFNTVKTDPPTKDVIKRPKRPKPQIQVDPSEIKDIPASAQLWEFLLKVLKKPKYNYMVSWESRKDGLFRFHDPSAFAALWGRHRNRPNMTYDKVARALRYYYRREILEPVGGRLTYKFTPRLCKQFMERIQAGATANNTTATNTTTTTSQD